MRDLRWTPLNVTFHRAAIAVYAAYNGNNAGGAFISCIRRRFVDINTAQRDGGCAGDQTHSLRICLRSAAAAAAAVAAAGYRYRNAAANRSALCRYCCRLLEAGAFGAVD